MRSHFLTMSLQILIRPLFLILLILSLIASSGCSALFHSGDRSSLNLTATAAFIATNAPPPTATITPSYVFPSCEPHPSAYAPPQAPLFTPSTPTSEAFPQAATLRTLAEQKQLLIGVSVSPSRVKNPQYAALITREFNMIVPENSLKWVVVHPEPERFDFTEGDTIIGFAQSHNLKVRGHVLVWDGQLPEWVLQSEHTREEWMHILCTHIKTLVTRYRGKVYAWDVVNEAFNTEGLLRETIWLQRIGPDYIAMAFQWAHEADDAALLFYNDFDAEGMNAKSHAIYAMAQALMHLGIPIHGIGMQMHTWLWGPPLPIEMKENMQRLEAIGLRVHITEMDIRLQYSPNTMAAKFIEQGEMYAQYMRTCLQAPNCEAFVTWGLSDKHSWIPYFTGQPDAPLLFDENLQPKPAYFAIMNALTQP